MNKQIFLMLILSLLVPFISALSVNIPSPVGTSNFSVTYLTNTNHSNSTDFWITSEGDLDDVSDILGSDITNDLGWAVGGGDSWSGNYTFYNNITTSNLKYCYANGTNSSGVNCITSSSSTDSWSTNYSNYYNKSQVFNNTAFNSTQMSNSGGYLNILISWLTSLFYTKSDIDNSIINNASYFSTYNSSYASNLDTNDTKSIQDMNASWLSTYNSTYASNMANNSFNQTFTDKLYANITFNYNQSNSFYNWLASFVYNYNQTSPAISWANDTIQANNNSWMSTYNSTYANNIDTDTWKTNYTFYYNKTELNNGTWTYYSDEIWINKNSSNSFNFNSSKLSTTYYNATQSEAVAGTIDGGTLVDTQHQDGKYDGITFNFSEVSATPGLDLRINFTGIDSFNQGVMRYKTASGLSGAYPIIQMWNYNTGAWEDYPPVAEILTFATITQPVFDSAEHLSNGVAQMRIYKSTKGNTGNKYYVDWIAISKGFGTPSGEEVDPYSFHKNQNINNSGYNITANYFIGDGSLLTGISTGNISNTSYYWVTSNNGTINGINTTWLDNVVGFLSFKLTQLETWFTGKLIDINNNINLNYTASLTYANGILSGNLTNYYNKSQVDYNFSLISSSDSWKGNFTFYYNKTQIDNNLSLYYLNSNPYNFVNSTTIGNSTIVHSGNYNCSGSNVVQNITINSSGIFSQCIAQSGTDSWSTNYSFYYNNTQINSIVSSNDTWRTNISLYWLATTINNILIGNSTAWLSTYNSTYHNNINTDSWSGNYTNYYNQSEVNNLINLNNTDSKTYSNGAIAGNLTLTLLKNGTTIATGNFNFGGFNISGIDNITVNSFCNSTKCYTLNDLLTTSSSTDSWSLNYSFYYNSTQINNIVSSNDTWRTNYTAYYTGANVNSALLSNLSLTLLVNGSRIVTGNMNFGGFNISNIDNLTSNKICNSSTCYVLSDFLATTGDGSYNLTYHNYVTANISNQTYNWITSNNLTMNGINITQMRNVNGILTVLRDWWDGLYCKLTGCTMTGDLNMNGNNITNVNNISSDYYCNATNCYTLINFLTDTTGGSDSWAGNYTFYYNKTLIDTNFSLYMLISSWNTNLTDINNNINNNLTASKTYANSIVAGNLTTVLLLNGSNTMTGNLNLSANVNITWGTSGSIQNNQTCIKIKGISSTLEIC